MNKPKAEEIFGAVDASPAASELKGGGKPEINVVDLSNYSQIDSTQVLHGLTAEGRPAADSGGSSVVLCNPEQVVSLGGILKNSTPIIVKTNPSRGETMGDVLLS